MSRKTQRWGMLVVAFIGIVIFGVACTDASKEGDDLRQNAVIDRNNALEEGQRAYPAPNITNYIMRGELVEFMARQDLVNHPWYIYLIDMNGDAYARYIGRTMPQSTCNFISSTDQIVWESTADPVVAAPSYDGMFYGGAGGSAACQAFFVRDLSTDAIHWFVEDKIVVSDQPVTIYDSAPLISSEQSGVDAEALQTEATPEPPQ